MADFVRFAIYYLPSGALAERGAAWLGWNLDRGAPVAHAGPESVSRDVITAVTDRPRRYGFHATLKPPFRLAQGHALADLDAACRALAAVLPVATASGLEVTRLGRFLALTPAGTGAEIGDVAARIVSDLDAFRAPPTEAELDRRRAAGLSPRQEAVLARWGYPYVSEEFRFHMTLTGPLEPAEIDDLHPRLSAHFEPVLPRPFQLDEIALLGEQEGGGFRCLHRYAVTG